MCLQGARNTVPSLVNRFIIQPLPGKDFLFPRAEAPWKGWTGQGDRRPHLHLRARKRVLRVRGRVQGHTAVMAVALQPDVSAPNLSPYRAALLVNTAQHHTFMCNWEQIPVSWVPFGDMSGFESSITTGAKSTRLPGTESGGSFILAVSRLNTNISI